MQTGREGGAKGGLLASFQAAEVAWHPRSRMSGLSPWSHQAGTGGGALPPAVRALQMKGLRSLAPAQLMHGQPHSSLVVHVSYEPPALSAIQISSGSPVHPEP